MSAARSFYPSSQPAPLPDPPRRKVTHAAAPQSPVASAQNVDGFDYLRAPHAFATEPHVPLGKPMRWAEWWNLFLTICSKRHEAFGRICSPAETKEWLAAREAEAATKEAMKGKSTKKKVTPSRTSWI